MLGREGGFLGAGIHHGAQTGPGYAPCAHLGADAVFFFQNQDLFPVAGKQACTGQTAGTGADNDGSKGFHFECISWGISPLSSKLRLLSTILCLNMVVSTPFVSRRSRITKTVSAWARIHPTVIREGVCREK